MTDSKYCSSIFFFHFLFFLLCNLLLVGEPLSATALEEMEPDADVELEA